jgi:hypothetical protein
VSPRLERAHDVGRCPWRAPSSEADGGGGIDVPAEIAQLWKSDVTRDCLLGRLVSRMTSMSPEVKACRISASA